MSRSRPASSTGSSRSRAPTSTTVHASASSFERRARSSCRCAGVATVVGLAFDDQPCAADHEVRPGQEAPVAVEDVVVRRQLVHAGQHQQRPQSGFLGRRRPTVEQPARGGEPSGSPLATAVLHVSRRVPRARCRHRAGSLRPRPGHGSASTLPRSNQVRVGDVTAHVLHQHPLSGGEFEGVSADAAGVRRTFWTRQGDVDVVGEGDPRREAGCHGSWRRSRG